MARDGKGIAKRGTGAKSDDGIKVVATNRRAFHDYHVLKEYEAGVQLVGTEVKSLRDGHCQLEGSYAKVADKEAVVWLHSVSIPEYKNAGPLFQHPPQRVRKLLLHGREIEAMRHALGDKGTTLIPLRVYFLRGRVKVLIGVCRGKRAHDKRESIKKRDVQREIARYNHD